MCDLELGKITSGLNEVSLRKQLPLRFSQSLQNSFTEKRPLQSDSTSVRQVSYFQRLDLQTQKDVAFPKSLSHYNTPSQLSKYFYSHQQSKYLGSPDYNYSKFSETSIHKKEKSSNPYSRPLSAKELVQKFSERKMASSSVTTHSKNNYNCKGNFPTNLNFFLKPQSLLKTDLASQKSENIAKHSLISDSNSLLKPVFNGHPKESLCTNSAFPQKAAFLSTAPTYVPVSSIGKHVSSIPKPGFSQMKPSERPLSVRNLNYTPAVSYDEVMLSYNSEVMDTQPDVPKEESDTLDNNNQTMYYKIGYKAEKCVSDVKLSVAAGFSPESCKAKSLLEDEEVLQPSINHEVNSATADISSAISYSPENSFIKSRHHSDGHVAINSEGETDDCLTEETDSDYEEECELDSSCSSLSQQLSSLQPKLTSPDQPSSTSSDIHPIMFPALTVSQFPNVPPTINFVYAGCKADCLPSEMKRLLRWRLSPITPLVVKSALVRTGFRITKKNTDWIGCFGKHMKSQAFRTLRDFQKLNHFPGSFQIGRKDRLWRNVSKLQLHFGKKEYGFFPQTFVLPTDLKLFKKVWEDGGNRLKWIIKPPASARGKGIRVVHKWSQIPKRRPIIVQRYLSRPYLINNSKFDIRLYVLVSSFDPLRIYLYSDGLVRFASCKYSTTISSLSNRCVHLTNYSINKMNPFYQNNTGDNFQGHKWSLKTLWNYLKKQGVNVHTIWESIKDIVTKTIISGEAMVSSLTRANLKSPYSAYELFGFDILLDENLKPWLLEVNISPSLHSTTPLDIEIKEPLVCDVLNIAGFHLPAKDDLLTHVVNTHMEDGHYKPPNNYCLDKRLYNLNLSSDEKLKHNYYCQRNLDMQIQQTILDILTPYDVRVLLLTLDEEKRSGNFERVFPSFTTSKYLRFFEQLKYSNLLLNQWFQRYPRLDSRGLILLKSYCESGIHLHDPTNDFKHQWNPPTLIGSSVHSSNAKCVSTIGKSPEKKSTLEKNR